MARLFLIVFLSIISINSSYANPSQLDVIGLVPGVSTYDQVEKAKNNYGYLIGGYELFCTPEYIDGVLSKFVCLTGEKYLSVDRTNNLEKSASNTEVHTVLSKGFQQKFGNPSKIKNIPLSNRYGMKTNCNIITWIDDKGNELILMSITDNIDQGALVFQSAKAIESKEQEKIDADHKRKF